MRRGRFDIASAFLLFGKIKIPERLLKKDLRNVCLRCQSREFFSVRLDFRYRYRKNISGIDVLFSRIDALLEIQGVFADKFFCS